MANMIGADPAKLDELAARFERASRTLDEQRRTLPVAVQGVMWLGQVASGFAQAVSGRHVPSLASAGQLLDQTASDLRKQAQAQRDASERISDLGSRRLAPTPCPPELAAKFESLENDPAALKAWLNTLTPEQLKAVVLAYPGQILDVAEPSTELYKKARQIFDQHRSGDAMVHATTFRGHVSAKLKLVNAEFGIEATSATYADGSVQVSVSPHLSAGKSFGDDEAGEAEAKLGLSGRRTYKFASQAEADAFLNDLKEAATPHAGDILGKPFAFAERLGAVLSQHEKDVLRDEVSADATITATSGEDSGHLGAGVTVSRDGDASETPGAVTIQAHAGMGGNVKLGPVSVSGDYESSAALKMVDGRPYSLVFTLDGSGKIDGIPGLESLAGNDNRTGHVQVAYDLTDPDVAAVANEVAEAIRVGDTAAAMKALGGCYEQADVTVQLGAVTDSSSKEHDLGLAKVGWGSETETIDQTFYKPPGGSGFHERQN